MTPQQLQDLRRWLSLPVEERDPHEGADLVRRLLHNPVLALHLDRFPQRTMLIASEALMRLLPRETRETRETRKTREPRETRKTRETREPRETRETPSPGRRADHDRLPEDIQALYKENLNLMQRIRHLHDVLLIHDKRRQNHPATEEEEVLEILKELIAADKQYHKNWEKYDTFIIDNG